MALHRTYTSSNCPLFFGLNGVVDRSPSSFFSFLSFPFILSTVFLSLLHSHFSSYAGEALLPYLLRWPTLFSLAPSFSICFESCHYSSLLRFLTCQARRYRLARLVHASSPTPLRWEKKQAWIALTPTWTSPSSSVSTLLEGRSSSLSMFTLLSMIVKPLYERTTPRRERGKGASWTYAAKPIP